MAEVRTLNTPMLKISKAELPTPTEANDFTLGAAQLNHLDSKAEGCGIRRLKVDAHSVFPAEAGIQAPFELEPETTLDAGVCRHDEPSLLLKRVLRRLEGADFNHSRAGHS